VTEISRQNLKTSTPQEKRQAGLPSWTASPDGLFRPQHAAACVSLSKTNNVKEPVSQIPGRNPIR
jgi:hypothetical protein